MSRTMGSLLIDLRLNLTDFNRDIDAAKQKASVAGKAIEASLKVDLNKTAANQYKATAAAMGKPLKPIVDDSALTALNKHLDLKQKHWGEVRRDFERPIKPIIETKDLISQIDKALAKERKLLVQTEVKEGRGEGKALVTDAIAKELAKGLEKGFKQSKVGSPGLLGNISRGYQEGVGQTFASKVTGGSIAALERSLNLSLEAVGDKFATRSVKVGRFAVDRTLKSSGVADGLEGLKAKAPEINKFFDEIIDEKRLNRKFSALELQIAKLIDDMLRMKGLGTQIQNIKGVSGAVGSIAKEPIEGVRDRRGRIIKESAAKAQRRADDIDVSGLAGVDRVVFGIGGFAGAESKADRGKSSEPVADRLGKLIGGQAKVIPIANRETDLSVNIGEGKLRWIGEAIIKLVRQNITGNADSIEAAAQAIAVKRANPSAKVSFAGYSAGGMVAQEAVEIAKAAGVGGVRGVGIGTPRFNATATTTNDEFQSVMGKSDPLNRLHAIFKPRDASSVSEGGESHHLANYLSGKDSQPAILKQLGLKPNQDQGLNSPIAYEMGAIEERIQGAYSDAMAAMSDPVFYKKTGLDKAVLGSIEGTREGLKSLIEKAEGELKSVLEGYESELSEAEDMFRSSFGLTRSKAAQAVTERKGKQGGAGLLTFPLTEQELSSNNLDVIKELSRMTGGAGRGKKDKLISELMAVDPKIVRGAISNLEPSLVKGPSGGVTIKKKPQSPEEKRAIELAKESEKRLNDTLRLFAEAEGDLRESMARVALAEIETTTAFMEDLKSSGSTDTRASAGRVRGRLGGLRSAFEAPDVEGMASRGSDRSMGRAYKSLAAQMMPNTPEKLVPKLSVVKSLPNDAKVLYSIEKNQIQITEKARDLFLKNINGVRSQQEEVFVELSKALSVADRIGGESASAVAEPTTRFGRRIKGVGRSDRLSRVLKPLPAPAIAFPEIQPPPLPESPKPPGLFAQRMKVPTVADRQQSALSQTPPRLAPPPQPQLNPSQFMQMIMANVAKVSSVQMKPADMPQLVVDDGKLKGMGAKGFYSIRKNQIIISKEMAEMLSGTLEDIQKYEEAIETLVHEARHAAQFKFGKSSVAGMAIGVNGSGVKQKPFAAASRRAQFNALKSADIAKREAGGRLPGAFLRVIRDTEADAYDFESKSPQVMAGVRGDYQSGNVPRSQQSKLVEFFVSSMKAKSAIGRAAKSSTAAIGSTFFGAVPLADRDVAPDRPKESKPVEFFVSALRAKDRALGLARSATSSVGAMAVGIGSGLLTPGAASFGTTPTVKTPRLLARAAVSDFGAAVFDISQSMGLPIGEKGIERFLGIIKKVPGAMGLLSSATSFASKNIGGLALGFGAFVGVKMILSTIGPMILGIADASTKAALEMQRLDRVIAAGTGSSYSGKAAIASIGKQADELGLNKRQALQGYAQFAGSTKDTALEGETGLGIFKNVSQAMGAQGVGGEQQERVFTALSQMASKGVVSMEELRQQVGESLPGALSVAARSMGMTTMEFSKLVESGNLLSADFLPKFAQQLAAESSTGLAGSAGSAQASLTRLGNSITDLQTSIGESILPVQKIGADVLVGAIGALIPLLEMAAKSAAGMALAFGWKAAAGFISSGAAATLMGKGLAAIGPAIAKALYVLAPMLATFVLMSVAIDAARAAFDALSVGLGGGTSKFQDFANPAAKSMNEYRDSLKSAAEAQKDLLSSLPETAQDIKGETVMDKIGATAVGGFIGGLFGNAKGGRDFVRATEEVPIKALGGTTTAQQNAYVNQIGMNNQLEGRSVAKLEVAKQLFSSTSEIAQLKLIDKELESIQSKKRAIAATDPNNTAAIKQLTDREQKLTKDREKPSAAVGKLQQSVAQEIELYKSAIKELEQKANNGEISRDEYVNKLDRYRAAIAGAEQDQNKLNKALKDTATSVESLEKAWAKIADRMEDAATAAKSVNDGQRVAVARKELAGGTQGSSDRSTELMVQAQLATKIKNEQAVVQSMRTLLATQGAETVRRNFGVTDQTGPAELKGLSDKATGPKEKAILSRMADLKRIEGELKSSEADLAEAQVAAQRRLKDLTKAVSDFYRGIEQQAKESALNAKSASIDIRSNNAKSKIVGALRGFQDNYISEFADSLVSLIDSFNEPFKIAIEAQKQILQKSQQLSDTMRQGQELAKSLPDGSEGMGPGMQRPALPPIGGGRAPSAQAGAIAANQVVGFTGQTGIGTGAHLDIRYERQYARSAGKEKGGIRSRPTDEHMARFTVGGKSLAQHKGAITSEYGPRRAPVAGASSFHEGIDFGFVNGTPISTNVPIKSVRSYESGGGGGIVTEVIFTDGVALNLLHMSPKSKGISSGSLKKIPGNPGGGAIGPAPRSVMASPSGPVSGRAMAEGGDDSYFMRAIGLSEGNRTLDGGKTKSYARHWDSVGKRYGSGSVSDIHGRSPQEAAAHWNSALSKAVDGAAGRLKAAGLGGDRQVALNIADMRVQSPAALQSKGGFLDKLPALSKALQGVEGLKPRQRIIDEFKAESYRNPDTGKLETSFGSKAALMHDQNRRGDALVQFMGKYDQQGATRSAPRATPNPYVAPRGVMAPTTGIGQGQVAAAESQAQGYAGLGDKVRAATAMAGQTAFAENTQIMQSAAAQSALKKMEYERASRKAQRQLTVGGRTMAKDAVGLSDQFDDLLAGIGPDTAQKGLGENLRKSKQTFRGYNESIRDAIELRESALMDAKGLSKLIASGQIQGIDPSIAKSLNAQIGPMESQLKKLYATRSEVSAAESKVIADYRDKYALDLKARSAEVKGGLTAAQIKSAQEEATLLKAQAEAPGVGPDVRDRNITRAASIDRYVSQVGAKSDYDRQKLELEKLRRDQPDAFKAGDLVARTKLLDEELARKLQTADATFATATAGIKQGADDRSLEQAAASMRQTIEGLNTEAQSLEIRAKELEASGDPMGAFDARRQSAQGKFQGDSMAKALDLSQAIEEQEKLVRANQKTREAADEAIAKLREQNGVSMANLSGELANVTRELNNQKAAAQAAMDARVREAEGQVTELGVKRMYRTGRGTEAIGAQRDLDVSKIQLDLEAKLRDVRLDPSLSTEARAKIEAELQQGGAMQIEDVQFNAKVALEDNQAQRRSMGAQSEMSILNAKASLAKTYGNDSSDYERQSALIGENERFTESLRSIDAQARQMGMGAEEVLKLKEAAGQLNQLNLENISAQFNPMVEAMNGVKGAFQGFLGDVISGNESIGDAFSKMVGNVGNMLAQLAAKLITQQLFSGLLGGLGGGGAAAGGGGGFLGGLFGFAEGGIVPDANHGSLRDRPDAIGKALRKEGPRSVLATLTPGEMVLTVQETRAYLNSSMRRSARNGIMPTNRMSQSDVIQGYKSGGIVPGGAPISVTNGGSQSNISVPITINNSGGDQPAFNVKRFEDGVRALVIAENRKAARPRSGS